MACGKVGSVCAIQGISSKMGHPAFINSSLALQSLLRSCSNGLRKKLQNQQPILLHPLPAWKVLCSTWNLSKRCALSGSKSQIQWAHSATHMRVPANTGAPILSPRGFRHQKHPKEQSNFFPPGPPNYEPLRSKNQHLFAPCNCKPGGLSWAPLRKNLPPKVCIASRNATSSLRGILQLARKVPPSHHSWRGPVGFWLDSLVFGWRCVFGVYILLLACAYLFCRGMGQGESRNGLITTQFQQAVYCQMSRTTN